MIQNSIPKKFVPNNIFDVIDHMKQEPKELQPQPSIESINFKIDSVEGKHSIESTSSKENHAEYHIDQRQMMSNMCEKFTNKKDVVRCKVIACFRDNKYCFK